MPIPLFAETVEYNQRSHPAIPVYKQMSLQEGDGESDELQTTQPGDDVMCDNSIIDLLQCIVTTICGDNNVLKTMIFVVTIMY